MRVRKLPPIDRWSCETSFGAMFVTGMSMVAPWGPIWPVGGSGLPRTAGDTPSSRGRQSPDPGSPRDTWSPSPARQRRSEHGSSHGRSVVRPRFGAWRLALGDGRSLAYAGAAIRRKTRGAVLRHTGLQVPVPRRGRNHSRDTGGRRRPSQSAMARAGQALSRRWRQGKLEPGRLSGRLGLGPDAGLPALSVGDVKSLERVTRAARSASVT